jgi:hypothetical protein
LRRFSAALPLSHSYCTQAIVPDTRSARRQLGRLHETLWCGLARKRRPSATAACSGVMGRHGR